MALLCHRSPPNLFGITFKKLFLASKGKANHQIKLRTPQQVGLIDYTNIKDN